ncbi:MAG: CatB-related O-acetyltransferase [Bacteroidetes bacterium]|nr:CatB-related O-acetyltransferase [Bacteroidota bacterium]
MRIFFRSVYQVLVGWKTSFTLRFVYPQKEKYKWVKSIIPRWINFGNGVVVEENVLFAPCFKKMGKHVVVGKNCYIGYCSSIGDFSGLGWGVMLGFDSHPVQFVSMNRIFYNPQRGWTDKKLYDEGSRGLTEVGCDAMVGSQSIILSGVSIGHGAVVAAGSFVNKNVPPYAIVRGIPARIVAYRFDEATIARLLASEWWNLPDEVLKKQVNHMDDPNAFLDALEKDGAIKPQ